RDGPWGAGGGRGGSRGLRDRATRHRQAGRRPGRGRQAEGRGVGDRPAAGARARHTAVKRIAFPLGLLGLMLAASPSTALGPYPELGGCPVFPPPPAGLPANAPSLPTEAAWNQDVSKAPVARNSAATIAYIDAHGGDHLHPDFGSPRAYGFPYSVVGAGQRRLP